MAAEVFSQAPPPWPSSMLFRSCCLLRRSLRFRGQYGNSLFTNHCWNMFSVAKVLQIVPRIWKSFPHFRSWAFGAWTLDFLKKKATKRWFVREVVLWLLSSDWNGVASLKVAECSVAAHVFSQNKMTIRKVLTAVAKSHPFSVAFGFWHTFLACFWSCSCCSLNRGKTPNSPCRTSGPAFIWTSSAWILWKPIHGRASEVRNAHVARQDTDV